MAKPRTINVRVPEEANKVATILAAELEISKPEVYARAVRELAEREIPGILAARERNRRRRPGPEP